MFNRVKRDSFENIPDNKWNMKNKRRKYSQNKRFNDDYEGPHSMRKLNYEIKNENCMSVDDSSAEQRYKSNRSENESKCHIKESIVYYERILQTLKQELTLDSKDIFAVNALQESEGKEVELSCYGATSHCLELLLTHCKDDGILQRFMSAFAEQRAAVCTSANASHITEILIISSLKAVQNWDVVMNSEDSEEKHIVSFNLKWLSDFGEFVVENLNDCLTNTYSCHVVCTLIQALSGDLSKPTGFMSRSSKFHKEKFHSQYIEAEESSAEQAQSTILLEDIPKFFSNILKKLYQSLLASENLQDLVQDGSSTTVIEALLCALKRRHPKSCKKLIAKLAEILFSEKNIDNVPFSLLHQNCSFVVNEIFKTADDHLQLALWHQYVEGCLGQLVSHPVGHFVVQRVFEVIKDKSVFQDISESVWPHFDNILQSQNFGIFLSMANACNRLGAQQAPFMKHIMLCLQCHEPEEQHLLLPLLLGFQRYSVDFKHKSQDAFHVCLQGSLVAQAVLKFHKPLKVVQSIINLPISGIEFLAGHIQGCHVLNAFFGSVSVGEKNKEKLLNNIKPVLLSIASDRNKSLTLSRIWTLLSMKLKEIIARELAENRDILVKNPSGYAIFKKFGIHYFKRLNEWREIQTNASYNKNTRRR